MPAMQVEIIPVVSAFFAGVAVGLFYFGGLWWTVRRLPKARNPQLLTFGSFAVRLVFAVGAVVLFARWHWPAGPACMAGFIAARIVLVRRLRPVRPSGAAEQEN